MKLTFLLLIAVTSFNPGSTVQPDAESSDIKLTNELAAAEQTKDYEKHPAFAVIRNCN